MKVLIRKAALQYGVALTALISAGNSHAEQQPEATTVEEVVVTAQKRAERLQSVPVTVTALTAGSLEAAGVFDAQKLQNVVTGLAFNRNLGNGTPYLRGVGQNAGGPGVESPIAAHVDGIYLVQPGSMMVSLGSNLERVEVDKGPQGTLFGRNATGGVIQVITKTPSTEPAFLGMVGYGNYNTASGDMYVTGKVLPGLAANLSVRGSNRSEGFINNRFLGKTLGQSNDFSVQNKWLFVPNDRTDVTLNLIYNSDFGYLGPTAGIYPGTVASDHVTTFTGWYDVYSGIETKNRSFDGLAGLTVNHDLGGARITSITGYHRINQRFNFVQNGEPLHNPLVPGDVALTNYNHGTGKSITEELQLKSPDGQDLRWLIGGFYLHDESHLDTDDLRENQFTFIVFSPSLIRWAQKTRSYAAFADATKTVLPDTRLTLGVRYTSDKKTLSGHIDSLQPNGTLTVTTPASAHLANPTTWNSPTWRAILDHNFSADIMGYLGYNRGFKSGLYNLSSFTNPPVKPETIDAYEGGIKTEFFHRRLRLNVAGYYYQYKDIQLRQTLTGLGSAGGAARFLLLNAASGTVKGIDLDLAAVPTDNLTINGGLSYLDARYGRFPGAPFAFPNPVVLPLPAGCTISGGVLPPAAALIGGNTTVSCDASGSTMIRSPKFTGNVGFTYVARLNGGSQLSFNANDHYSSRFFWDVDHRLTQAPYHDVSTSVTWTSSSGHFDVTAWATNLADEIIFTTATAGNNSLFMPGEPRMYGMRLGVRL